MKNNEKNKFIVLFSCDKQILKIRHKKNLIYIKGNC
jgi:hypothetical protein